MLSGSGLTSDLEIGDSGEGTIGTSPGSTVPVVEPGVGYKLACAKTGDVKPGSTGEADGTFGGGLHE